jgi:hypothetical protein
MNARVRISYGCIYYHTDTLSHTVSALAHIHTVLTSSFRMSRRSSRSQRASDNELTEVKPFMSNAAVTQDRRYRGIMLSRNKEIFFYLQVVLLQRNLTLLANVHAFR